MFATRHELGAARSLLQPVLAKQRLTAHSSGRDPGKFPDEMRSVARWLGELLSGEGGGGSLRSVLVRCALMSVASAAIAWAAIQIAFEHPGGTGGIWKGLIVLAISLGLRVLFELRKLDGVLAASVLFGLASGGLAVAVAQNVAETPALAPRLWVFAAIAALAAGVAVWRVTVCIRRGD